MLNTFLRKLKVASKQFEVKVTKDGKLRMHDDNRHSFCPITAVEKVFNKRRRTLINVDETLVYNDLGVNLSRDIVGAADNEMSTELQKRLRVRLLNAVK